MLLFRPCAAVRAGPLLRTTSRMLVVSPRRSARPVAVATEAAVPVFDERLVSEDPELVKRSLLRRKAGDALIASVDRIGELTAEVSQIAADDERFEDLVDLTVHLLRGMSLQRILRKDDSRRRRHFELWKRIVLQTIEHPAAP